MAKHAPTPTSAATREIHHSAQNADEALRILGIIEKDPAWGEEHSRWKIAHWAAQAALGRPGRRQLRDMDQDNIRMFVMDADQLKWPRGRLA